MKWLFLELAHGVNDRRLRTVFGTLLRISVCIGFGFFHWGRWLLVISEITLLSVVLRCFKGVDIHWLFCPNVEEFCLFKTLCLFSLSTLWLFSLRSGDFVWTVFPKAMTKLSPQATFLTSALSFSSLFTWGIFFNDQLPWPNSPYLFVPHEYISPLLFMSKVKLFPTPIESIGARSFLKSLQILCTLVGTPNSPMNESPQMKHLPLVSMAAEWEPALIFTISDKVGIFLKMLLDSTDLMPSCPELLLPDA